MKDKQFTNPSTHSYDRHHYRVWLSDGSFKDVESYDDAQRIWYASPIKPKTIEVTQPRKRHGAKGFEWMCPSSRTDTRDPPVALT